MVLSVLAIKPRAARHRGGQERQLVHRPPRMLDKKRPGEIQYKFPQPNRRSHEADLSAKPKQTQGLPRLSKAHEHCRRPKGPQAAPGQGPPPVDCLGPTFWHMVRRGSETVAARLRRRGVRLSAGPWTVCAETAPAGGSRLIVALGRTAGAATARSRIRRIARGVFFDPCRRTGALAVLLLARSDVSRQPRRQVRASLVHLCTRLSAALARRDVHGN